MNFSDTLISVYRERPCQVLPNALWKTLAEANRGDVQIEVAQTGGTVTRLALWDAQRLLVYWNRDRTCSDRLLYYLEGTRLALVHQDFLHVVPNARFAHRQAYFRLIQPATARVQFALPTVAGKANARSVNGQSNPEALYRSCGFIGNDLWWVMTQ